MQFRLIAFAFSFVFAATASLAAEPRLGLETQYFAGHSQVHDANGQEIGTSRVVIKRQIWMQEKLIIEDSVIRYSGQSSPNFFVTVARWDGDRMRIVEKSDVFRGQGTLIGEEGHWTSWNSQSLMNDGVRVTSEDRLLPDRLEVHKRIVTPGGELAYDVRENLKIVSEAEFQEIWQQVSGQGRPVAPRGGQ